MCDALALTREGLQPACFVTFRAAELEQEAGKLEQKFVVCISELQRFTSVPHEAS